MTQKKENVRSKLHSSISFGVNTSINNNRPISSNNNHNNINSSISVSMRLSNPKNINNNNSKFHNTNKSISIHNSTTNLIYGNSNNNSIVHNKNQSNINNNNVNNAKNEITHTHTNIDLIKHVRSSTNKESMISTINNNHSIHYNNSKQNKNNIHKSDDKNKIKEKEEKKSNAEIKKNNSQRRIVKNSDENKENKNTENIKKDYKKKKERKSSMENKDNNESKDIKEIPKELSSNKSNITKYNKDNNTNSEENKPIKNAASSIKNKIDTDEEKVKYFDTSKITNVQIPKDYLNIIYYNLLIEEKKGISPMPDHTYMGRQSEINEKMRSILVDWLIDVHFKFGFTDETLFMTVSIIDRYLSVEQITRTNFQLLGITALMIACKHEEIDLPKIDDFIYITDNAYKKNEVIKMEFDVLSKLNFAFLYPSPIKFFEYLSFNFNFEKKQHMMGKYLMESFLLDVKNTKYKPSIISCACAYIVMKFFKMKNYQETYNKKFFVLDETKEKFSEHNIKECAKDICLLVDNINKTNYQACVKKYSKPEQENVAMIIMNN